MSSLTLTANPVLGGASHEQNGLQLLEIPNLRLMSIAANENQLSQASQTLESHCNVHWPDVGQSSLNNDVRALGLQAEQIFLMINNQSDAEFHQLANDVSGSAYVTEQSDSWVAVAVSGSQRHAALERICPLNLHDSVFPDGAVARTSMEYLSVIIVRDADRFILLSPRSSAQSFWHMLMVTAKYI